MDVLRTTEVIEAEMKFNDFCDVLLRTAELDKHECVIKDLPTEKYTYGGDELFFVKALEINKSLIGYYWIADENSKSHHLNFSDEYITQVELEKGWPKMVLPELTGYSTLTSKITPLTTDQKKSISLLNVDYFKGQNVNERFENFQEMSEVICHTIGAIKQKTGIFIKLFNNDNPDF